MKTKTNVENEITSTSKLYAGDSIEFSKTLKKEKKLSLLKELGVKKNTRRLTAGVVIKKSDTDTNYLFEEIMPGLNDLDVNVIVVGEQKNHYGEYKNIHYLPRNPKNIRKIQEGCDLFLLPDAETEDNALRNGTPCIFLNDNTYRGHLLDFQPLQETGNGFSFNKKSPWLLFQSICRSLETYTFSYDWGTICGNSFETGRGL